MRSGRTKSRDPNGPGSPEDQPYDAAPYRARHAVDNVFQRLKVFRRLATRFEKTKRTFFAFICCVLVAIYTAGNLW